ncbi:leucine-rich repeat-containing protein 63 [Dipodomys spectabilis]|uniref:leucine-rich repeat-containing protein 63 n=1 Tax=Dipodomys spectabilis TaxID=105255 RepID=UPI001C5444DF|nr:leucine-rich repeat-containing protein 63 [Dipodomys spectabilis]
MEKNYCKIEKPLILLRRPLPPKLPKLSTYKKKITRGKTIIPKPIKVGSKWKLVPLKQKKTEPLTAKTSKTKLLNVPVTEDKIIPKGIGRTRRLEVSEKHPQLQVSVCNICLDLQIPGRRTMIPKSVTRTYWHLPETAPPPIFFPRCQSASKRVFGEKLKKQLKKKIPVGQIRDSSDIPSKFSQPFSGRYLVITTRLKESSPQLEILPKITDSELPSTLKVSTEVLVSSASSSVSIKPEKTVSWKADVKQIVNKVVLGDVKQIVNKVVLGSAKFVGMKSLPIPVIPRKPQRQSEIGLIRTTGTIRTIKPDSHVLRGEGFKSVAATRYETIMAIVELAIVTCQVHGRNALNLKGFSLRYCPDLSPIALQLVYLNLAFNDLTQFPHEILSLKNLQVLILRNNPIKEIPSEIYHLKYLRVFAIGFNLIYDLPSGLFSLPSLEELDVSYNEFTAIPNEIQKLSSLDKLNVDGNELTAFPSGILDLNLTKLQYENTYTHPAFWEQNSRNSPLRLTDICAFYILRNNLCMFHDEISAEVQSLLESTSTCDWCQGPRFGGFHIIRSTDIFGTAQLPILFLVCSTSCLEKMRETNFIYTRLTNKIITLNVDWTDEEEYS